jgi:hypothetical protein
MRTGTKRIKKDAYFEWFFVGILFVSELAGFQIAIFTPDTAIPLVLFVLWVLVQGAVSFFLVSHVWHAIVGKKKEASRLLNMAVICIALQGLGIFRSHQLFAGAAAIADSFLLYLMYHWD